MSTKWVYFFGKGRTEGDGKNKNLLGGKGAGLAEMTSIGIPVPPGFTITTEACVQFYKDSKSYPAGLWDQVLSALAELETAMGKKFGDINNPLLVSVRSGARVSMPGMMDTVLNLGLTDESVKGLEKSSGNARFAYDSYRRFIQMFSDVVLGIGHHQFEHILKDMKNTRGVKEDTELSAEDLKELVKKYKALVVEEIGKEFPQDPKEQLRYAIDAVFDSWNNQRAKTYRKINKMSDDWGTAVNVQSMVFGNMGDDCGTGVAFTRNPSTGDKEFFGEYLVNAQGEDVVAGIRTPEPIAKLKTAMPEVFAQLEEVYKKLENHYKDVQDIEFTIEKGTLYMLQTRTGKRTARAAVKIAFDMVAEGLIDKKTAVLRVAPEQVDQLLHPMIDTSVKYDVIAKGLPASPGAAVGKVVFTAEEAESWAAQGEKVILVRAETSPEDIGGMHAAQGILTATGGMTSHAAVVARGMGKCCVAGCGAVRINDVQKFFTAGGATVKEGDIITINGSTGEVILGAAKLIEPELSGEFAEILTWADSFRTLGVRANADTPHDSRVARDFGAEGIGLCRTEHMFFDGDRIDAVREMILADNEEGRRKALAKVKPYQKEDFLGLFTAMEGLPVTIRLLDPPLHEFIPHTDEEIERVSKASGISADHLKAKATELFEFNPMLGHRGCRLGLTFPEIYEMQVYAIFEAACELVKQGKVVKPEVMIPLVGSYKELEILKDMTNEVAAEVIAKYGVKLDYLVGTMIELPRAALTANEIAEHAQFFSFGTNDLTQTTLGVSRDDAGKFLPIYVEKGIYKEDPFVSIDVSGVGQLVEMGVSKGRSIRADLKTGICGEHGGDPESIAFCQKAGLNYVSCSPFRVPVARLAAAHAALKQ
ncbi:pyruvate, phosphate dikinase [Seleniivibrio woodruffii]|uniref:pyruvate, phosphate dikinase n=1 Tax=Seleniivibrio woodruffii TaxID=1078050 RepID=UPI0026F18213|nr:pyruvate, phosphate dikinase [Seleniivibrio woodruffii]